MQDIRKYFISSKRTPKYDVYEDHDETSLSTIHPPLDYENCSTTINQRVSSSSSSLIIEVDPEHVLGQKSIANGATLSTTPSEAPAKTEGNKRKENEVTRESSFLSSIHNASAKGDISGSDICFRTPVPSPSKSKSGRKPKTSKGSGSRIRTPTSGATPGSTCKSFTELPPSSIVAIVEGRGQARREIGMACVDLNRPLLSVVHFSDTHTYTRTLTKLTVLNPLEIIFSSTAEEERLMKVVRECLDGVAITTIQRKYFNETRGLSIIRHLSVPQCKHLERQISTKYYSLAAVSALIRYVEQIQHITYSPHSMVIHLSSSELVLTIDHSSCKKLELVRNLSSGWEHSLFGAIRYTCTPSGTRMLRASLLQPFADPNIIESRLSALEYLTQNPELFYSLKSILSRFPDLDWILSMCIQKHKEDTESRMEQRLNYVIGLKNTLELLGPLKMALEAVENPFFVTIKEAICVEGIDILKEILRLVLHEDARLLKGSTAMKAQRCYAIKAKVDGYLDIARLVYSEIVDDITNQVECLGKHFDLPTRVGHNSSRGFHIIIPIPKNAAKPKLPSCFIQTQYGRGCITCTTEEVYQLDQRSREKQKEILTFSNVIVLELIAEIRERVGMLHGVAEAVAVLDMVIGLAHAASLGGWVRPSFSDHINIQKGKHAILDLLSTTPIVPNNTYLNQEERVMIISGPNMSGKSTYLKQVALIQVLAQIGSFVPAESATLKVVDHLFTLLGCEDNPENNASTFQVQMNEVSVALQISSDRSLIILDELGQGTNLDEGTSLGWAIVEGFLLSRAFVLFATHIFPLTRIPELYPQVVNYHMENSLTDDKKLRLSHLLQKGINESKNYGLSLASSTFLPQVIIKGAYEVSAKIEDSMKKNETPTKPDSNMAEEDAVYILAHRLLGFAASAPTKYTSTRTTSPNKSTNSSICTYSDDDENQLKELLKDMLNEFLSHPSQQ